MARTSKTKQKVFFFSNNVCVFYGLHSKILFFKKLKVTPGQISPLNFVVEK